VFGVEFRCRATVVIDRFLIRAVVGVVTRHWIHALVGPPELLHARAKA
jgi:hypothetical protein